MSANDSLAELPIVLRFIEQRPKNESRTHWRLDTYQRFFSELMRRQGGLGVIVFIAGSGSAEYATSAARLAALAAAYSIALGPTVEGEGTMGIASSWGDRITEHNASLTRAIDQAWDFAGWCVREALCGPDTTVGIGIGRVGRTPHPEKSFSGVSQLDGTAAVPFLHGDLLNTTAQLVKSNLRGAGIILYREEFFLLQPPLPPWAAYEMKPSRGGRQWWIPATAVPISASPATNRWVIAGFCLDIGGSTAAGREKPWLTRRVVDDFLGHFGRLPEQEGLASRVFLAPPAGDSIRGLALLADEATPPDISAAFLRALAQQQAYFADHPSAATLDLHARLGITLTEGSATGAPASAPPLAGIVAGGTNLNPLVDSWNNGFVAHATAIQGKLKRVLGPRLPPRATEQRFFVGIPATASAQWQQRFGRIPADWTVLPE